MCNQMRSTISPAAGAAIAIGAPAPPPGIGTCMVFPGCAPGGRAICIWAPVVGTVAPIIIPGPSPGGTITENVDGAGGASVGT